MYILVKVELGGHTKVEMGSNSGIFFELIKSWFIISLSPIL